MRRLSLLLTFILSASALALAASAHAAIVRIPVDDVIHPISAEFISRGIDEAAKTHAELVIIELRTPGGLEDSMRVIVQKILKSPVPVAVYVAPSGGRAASAGFFILEAADIAAMAPGTNTGAAHPVLLGEKMDDVMKVKLENDAAALMRSVVLKRQRNVAAAESAVRESKSFSEQEALTQKLIDFVAPDMPSLLRAIDGRTITRFDGSHVVMHTAGKAVLSHEMTLKEQIFAAILNPNIVYFLLAVGGLAIFAELNHPGAVAPGVIGLICILVAAFALDILPTRFAALALILVAFALFALEAKFASHGVLGIGGVVCMVLGGLLLIDSPIPEMRVRLATTLAVSIPIGFITFFLMSLALKARKQRVVTGQEGMIGEIGVARTSLEPEGKVFVHGELWNAVAKTTVPEGARVRVKSVEGLHVMVEQAD
jgi:membrane-bound serine protease (ClpP class)